MNNCSKCDGSGWIPYSNNKLVRCDACCPHVRGFGRMAGFKDNKTQYLCVDGCGKIVDKVPNGAPLYKSKIYSL